MNLPKPKLTWLLYAAVAGVLLYGGLYYTAAHGEAYHFIESSIIDSPVIRERLGQVMQVRLKPFGGFSQKTMGKTSYARMTVDVSGETGAAVVDVMVVQRDGEWEVKDTSIDGQPVLLKEPEIIVKPIDENPISPAMQTSRYKRKPRRP